MFNSVKWQFEMLLKRRNAQNALSRPAAYSQLTPNFGWIECITSTHEARQRDTKMMKNTEKKNINTQQNITLTHSLTRHILHTESVRMQRERYGRAVVVAVVVVVVTTVAVAAITVRFQYEGSCRASFCSYMFG